MYPFRNILFPTDFTPRARPALKYAAAFARSGGGRVVLFCVQNGKVPNNLLTLPENVFSEKSNDRWTQLRTDARSVLGDALLKGLDVEPVIVAGEPSSAIATAVRDYDIDLVTVLAHGRKGLARALFGSTAEEIIAEAPCPVLTIRPSQHHFIEQRDERIEVRLKRILLSTNFRPSSATAAHVAKQLASQTGAELHVVYVIGDYLEQLAVLFPEGGFNALNRLRNHAQDHMKEFTRGEWSRAKAHIVEGRPYEEIVRLAAATDTDLIVMGTTVHASLFGGTPVLGSETERVVRNAPCPVLCVPATRAVTPLPALISQPVS
jgi:nucleotide-binding universal stress UspA family protein